MSETIGAAIDNQASSDPEGPGATNPWVRLDAAMTTLETAVDAAIRRQVHLDATARAESDRCSVTEADLAARSAEVDRLRLLLTELESLKTAATARAVTLESRLADVQRAPPQTGSAEPDESDLGRQRRIDDLAAELDRLRRDHAALRQAAGDAFARIDRAMTRLQAGG